MHFEHYQDYHPGRGISKFCHSTDNYCVNKEYTAVEWMLANWSCNFQKPEIKAFEETCHCEWHTELHEKKKAFKFLKVNAELPQLHFLDEDEVIPNASTGHSKSTVGGFEDSVGTYKRNWMFISGVVTHKFWFSWFMSGVHKQVGQVRKPDRVLTIDIIHAVDRILEIEWENARRAEEQKHIAEMGAWFIGGFCPSLHAKFGVNCVPVTQGMHLGPGRWVKILVETIHGMGRHAGRLFS
jgi:hypothetical protein